MSTFARIPDRLGELLRLGEITFDQFGLMVILVEMADYKTRTVTFASVEVLRHQLGWARRGQERDEKTVRNCLHRLRELGEIAYESRQGQRGDLGRGWKIRIVKDDYFGSARTSPSEVTSDTSKPQRPRTAGQDEVFGRVTPRTDSAGESPDTDTDGDVEAKVDKDIHQSSSEEVSALIDESLTATAVDQLLALVDPADVESNTRRVIADLVSALPPYRVQQAVDSLRAAQSRGELRNSAKYLVGILQRMT